MSERAVWSRCVLTAHHEEAKLKQRKGPQTVVERPRCWHDDRDEEGNPKQQDAAHVINSVVWVEGTIVS